MDEMKLHKDEVQIEACGAAPIIKGKPLDFVKWYKVEPDKITICRYDRSFQKEVTEEFDIHGVKLSGVPAGYFLRERSVEGNSADERRIHHDESRTRSHQDELGKFASRL